MSFQFRDLTIDLLPLQMAPDPTCQFCSDHSPPVDRPPGCQPSCPQGSHPGGPGGPGGPPPGDPPPGSFAADFALLSRQLQGSLAELR